jgi:hypothetical protein
VVGVGATSARTFKAADLTLSLANWNLPDWNQIDYAYSTPSWKQFQTINTSLPAASIQMVAR